MPGAAGAGDTGLRGTSVMVASSQHLLRIQRREPGRTGLAADVRIVALSASDASSLRDTLVRAGVRVEPETEEGLVCVSVSENRRLSAHVLLGVIERWARDRGFAEVFLRYGEKPYRLVTSIADRGD